ncbi:hypothetical protein [Hyalangium gracile]|uniref:hypothetical protein n=1 Tax=Hyalangium gracile TaxID=394092 RepID=UPI001CCED518|nr:hypothetical protein [Hyalangium gracile]
MQESWSGCTPWRFQRAANESFQGSDWLYIAVLDGDEAYALARQSVARLASTHQATAELQAVTERVVGIVKSYRV